MLLVTAASDGNGRFGTGWGAPLQLARDMLATPFGAMRWPPDGRRGTAADLIARGPLIVYVFASSSANVAILLMISSVLAGLIDNVLKPILFGRGAGVPGDRDRGHRRHDQLRDDRPIRGAVVLAVGYELFAALDQRQ